MLVSDQYRSLGLGSVTEGVRVHVHLHLLARPPHLSGGLAEESRHALAAYEGKPLQHQLILERVDAEPFAVLHHQRLVEAVLVGLVVASAVGVEPDRHTVHSGIKDAVDPA